jgi:hypothetical protein
MATKISPTTLSAPQAGEVVSMPLAQFKKIVELCSQVLQESKLARQFQRDLERGDAPTSKNVKKSVAYIILLDREETFFSIDTMTRRTRPFARTSLMRFGKV